MEDHKEHKEYSASEIIPTSDSEELEAIRSEESGYWEIASHALSTNRGLLDPTTRLLPFGRTYPAGGCLSTPSTHRSDGSSPPRKRIRLSRSTENTPPRRNASTEYLRAMHSSPIQLPSPKPSTSPPLKTSHAALRLGPGNSLSTISNNAESLLTPSPTLSLLELQSLPPASTDHLRLPSEVGELSTTKGSTLVLASDSEDSEVRTSSLSSSFREHLFTPPRSQEAMNIDRQRSSDSINEQRTFEQAQLTLSPLTPIPSPLRSPLSLSPHRPQGIERTRPSRPPDRTHEALSEAHLEAISQAEHEHRAGRYRLRERQAKQLNPYLYDAKLYKRQLRWNPDAIVHIDPAARRDHARSHEQPDSSDQEVDPSQLELEESDGERPRRRRSTSAVSEGVSHTGNEAGPSSPRNTTERWHPAAFDIDFSSDDDDMPLKTAYETPEDPSAAEKTDKDSRRPRRRRFPLFLKNLHKQKSTSFSLPNRESPAQQSFVRTASHRSIESSDDGPESVPESNRKRSSPSRPVEEDNWQDIFADGESLSADDLPPTSAHASSESMDVDNEQDDHTSSVGEDDFVVSDTNLSPHLRHRPYGDLGLQEGTSRLNPIKISDDEGISDLSNESSSGDTESDSEPDPRQTAAMKILKRMYPPGWIKQQLATRSKHKSTARHHAAEDTEERPVQPGHVRVRRRATPLSSAEIRGDTDSSEDEPTRDDQPSLDLFVAPLPRRSRSPSAFRAPFSPGTSQRSFSPAVPRNRYSRSTSPATFPLDQAFTGGGESSESESEGDGVLDAIEDKHRAIWNEQGISVKRDPSLVDYMLNRTGLKKPKLSHKQSTRHQGSRRPRASSSGLRVITHNVRSNGGERQTLLPFSRAKAVSAGYLGRAQPVDASDAPRLSSRHPGADEQTSFLYDLTIGPITSKQKNRSKRTTTAGVYTFSGSGRKISTGRSHPQAHTVQEEDEWSVRRLIDRNRVLSQPMPPPISHPMPATRVPPVSRGVQDAESPIRQYFSGVEARRARSEAPTGQPGTTLSIWPTGDEKVDCGVNKLLSGIAFPAKTDLSEGRLRELISSSEKGPDITPPSVYFRQTMLDPSMPIASFVDIVDSAISTLIDTLSREGAEISTREYEDWCHSLKNVGPYMTWFRCRSSPDGLKALHFLLSGILTRVYGLVEDSHALRSDDGNVNLLVLELQWHSIETAYRLRPDQPFHLTSRDPADVVSHFTLLVNHLLACEPDEPLVILRSPVDSSKLHQRVAELWICLIHLTQSWEQLRRAGSLWDILQQALSSSSIYRPEKSWLVASERIWTTIFSLCAWSQFSQFGITTVRPRLPASWKLVDFALARAKLTRQDNLPSRPKKKLDSYIRKLISRCHHLHQTWNWELQDVIIVLKRLLEIFKSRHFTNLTKESTDYPAFLKENNLDLLDEQKGSAYVLFLKLVVAAAKDASPAQVKKILSVTGPVGSVSFRDASSRQTFSSLYNRLSFVAIAVYLDPDDARNLIAKARRYVDLKEMDHLVCRGCIRGAMYIGMMLRKKDRSLQDVVDWLTEVADELIGQFDSGGYPAQLDVGAKLGNRGNTLMVSIQLVLGSISRIIKAEPWRGSWYPDPALLAERCIAHICVPETKLTASETTAKEIHKFIMTYLDVRDKPLPSRLTHPPQGESQESQEEYGLSAIDFEDSDLLAAFDDEDDTRRRQERDHEVVNRIHDGLMPVLDRLVCQGVQELKVSSKTLPLFGWVECWVACASTVVRSGRKAWPFYVQLAELFWKEVNPILRLKLRLRFRLVALRFDPSAYETDKIEFLRIMLQCMAVQTMSLAHDYVALVLWNDGLEHPILRGLPCGDARGRERFELSKEAFTAQRASFVERIIENISESLRLQSEGDRSLAETYVGLLHSMLISMKDFPTNFNNPEEIDYLDFCRRVYQALSRSEHLTKYPTVWSLVTWLQSILALAAS